MGVYDGDVVDQQNLRNSFRRARRETWVILVAWALLCLWVVGYCARYAFRPAPGQQVEILWGLPAWVVWGIAVPWVAANVFTIWFCFVYLQDEVDVVSEDADDG